MVLKRIGECKRCGKCCSFGTLMGADMNPKESIKPCYFLNLDKSTGKHYCRNYDDRPSFCKLFPAEPADNAVIQGCGFSFVEVEE